VKVDENKVVDNEWYGDNYQCPNPECSENKYSYARYPLWHGYKFCPHCGITLEWEEE